MFIKDLSILGTPSFSFELVFSKTDEALIHLCKPYLIYRNYIERFARTIGSWCSSRRRTV